MWRPVSAAVTIITIWQESFLNWQKKKIIPQVLFQVWNKKYLELYI